MAMRPTDQIKKREATANHARREEHDNRSLESPAVPDPAQAWFWTPEWQAGEREAETDIQEGRITRFGSMDDLLGTL